MTGLSDLAVPLAIALAALMLLAELAGSISPRIRLWQRPLMTRLECETLGYPRLPRGGEHRWPAVLALAHLAVVRSLAISPADGSFCRSFEATFGDFSVEPAFDYPGRRRAVCNHKDS